MGIRKVWHTGTENDEDILQSLNPAESVQQPFANGNKKPRTDEVQEPKKDPEKGNEPPVRNTDKQSLWEWIKGFFAEAPTGAGAGTVRMRDDSDLDEKIADEVWNGEELFSPDLFRFFSGEFLNAIQTSLNQA